MRVRRPIHRNHQRGSAYPATTARPSINAASRHPPHARSHAPTPTSRPPGPPAPSVPDLKRQTPVQSRTPPTTPAASRTVVLPGLVALVTIKQVAEIVIR